MAQLVLFEDAGYVNLLPLVYWRSVHALRCGRKTLLDNAAQRLKQPISGVWTRGYMADVAAMRMQMPVNKQAGDGTILVNARWLPSGQAEFRKAPFVATSNGAIVYIACDRNLAEQLSPETVLDTAACERLSGGAPTDEIDAEFIDYPWDLVAQNAALLSEHWTGDDRGIEGKLSSAAYTADANHVHVGERSEVMPTAFIDARNGPVYISNDVTICPHSCIEGPVYIGPGSIVKPHACIRGGTTLGTMCRVAGEVSSTIMSGYCNKQHDGFLGDACLGSWINIGAAATNSNLKNSYGEVRVQLGDRRIGTGRQFFGCVIGDFARLGIGQLIPTGAVIGFGAMVATGGFCPQYVPSLAWLTAAGKEQTDVKRLLETADCMMARRDHIISEEEKALFERIPSLAERYGI